MNDARIGFVGAGNMAGAMIEGLLASGTPPAQIRASEPREDRRGELSKKHGIATHAANADVVRWASVVVLAVKPQVIPAALDECRGISGVDVLYVSIAAGISLGALETGLGARVRVVRAMPNTPALARAGITALAGGTSATPADLATARALFDTVGRSVVLPEAQLDAVTGLSGSGPAYVLFFIEALTDGGVKMGLPRDVALLLAAETVLGSARLLLASGEHPARLRDQVTSPGGTTIAGLHALEAGGVRGAIIGAVEAATRRSMELGGRK